MIHWIGKTLVLAIHDRQLAEHGGQPGIRDEALLDSAFVRPRQTLADVEPPTDLATLAASLAYGLARNPPFLDGNKRTAAVTCETFIMLNGAALDATDVELYPLYHELAGGGLSEAELATWLCARIVSNPAGEQPAAHEPAAVYRS